MKYDNVKYEECNEVYPPAEDTFMFIDNLEINDGDNVLEVGCGTGIVSIFASFTAENVISCDINPYAIDCAEKNIKLNKRSNVTVIESDLFSNIDNKFDVILFNTPYLPVDEDEQEDSEYSKAWDGGSDGRKVIDKFLEQAGNYLKDHGKIQLVQSSLSDNEKTLNYLNENGYDAKITANEHIFFEDITLITAVKKK